MRLKFLLVALICLVVESRAAALRTQSIPLQPGWNAISVEVDPVANDPGVVFTNLPVASVWSRVESLGSATFVQDQNAVQNGDPGWLVWYPKSKPESAISSLFAIHGHHSYLLKLEGSAAVTLNITGEPVFLPQKWIADGYSLRGFPIDSATPPSFGAFFRPSAAHFNASLNQLRGVYRLNSSGNWTAVLPQELMRGGEGCWVFTQGASDYNGPLAAALEVGESLDFSSSQDQLEVKFKNGSVTATTVTVRDLGPGGASQAQGIAQAPIPTPLSTQQFNSTNGLTFAPLQSQLTFSAAPGETRSIHFGIRRYAFASDAYDSVLEIKDNIGNRHLIPIRATRRTKAVYAGLWMGNVTLKAVSEANSGTISTNPITLEVVRAGGSTNPTPVKSEFTFRILVHVDTNGQARLLKEVVQMFQNGTYTNNAAGNAVVATPGRYVLITDDRLISRFQGASMRDGVSVGRRISTAAFDFNLGPTNHLNLNGAFSLTGELSASMTSAPNDPTNPFRHKFHPDHDNLDVRFASYSPEAYEVRRDIRLSFSAADPQGGSDPSYGYSVMGGTYSETLTGLHKVPVLTQGVFRLEHVSDVAVLNQ
jgi:hypothetical protein